MDPTAVCILHAQTKTLPSSIGEDLFIAFFRGFRAVFAFCCTVQSHNFTSRDSTPYEALPPWSWNSRLARQCIVL